jgi:hypothetical protein
MAANKFVVFFYTGELCALIQNWIQDVHGTTWSFCCLAVKKPPHPMWSPWSSAGRPTQQTATQVPGLGFGTLSKLDHKVTEVGILWMFLEALPLGCYRMPSSCLLCAGWLSMPGGVASQEQQKKCVVDQHPLDHNIEKWIVTDRIYIHNFPYNWHSQYCLVR